MEKSSKMLEKNNHYVYEVWHPRFHEIEPQFLPVLSALIVRMSTFNIAITLPLQWILASSYCWKVAVPPREKHLQVTTLSLTSARALTKQYWGGNVAYSAHCWAQWSDTPSLYWWSVPTAGLSRAKHHLCIGGLGTLGT